MPAKKDSAGQPPPKPKPEDLIAEFKEKFEKYATDVRHEASELESKIASLESSQAETRQLVESGHSEQQAGVRRLHEDLVHTINHKFGELEGDIRESFTLLEKKLSEGRKYVQKLWLMSSSLSCPRNQQSGRHGPPAGGAGRGAGGGLGQARAVRGEEEDQPHLLRGAGRGQGDAGRAHQQGWASLLIKVRSLDVSISMPPDYQHYPVLPEHEEERDRGERRPAHVRPQGGQLQVEQIESHEDCLHVFICRPVVVSFEEATAREEVLQKAAMLKGSNVYIMEDLSR